MILQFSAQFKHFIFQSWNPLGKPEFQPTYPCSLLQTSATMIYFLLLKFNRLLKLYAKILFLHQQSVQNLVRHTVPTTKSDFFSYYAPFLPYSLPHGHPWGNCCPSPRTNLHHTSSLLLCSISLVCLPKTCNSILPVNLDKASLSKLWLLKNQ